MTTENKSKTSPESSSNNVAIILKVVVFAGTVGAVQDLSSP